jgi:translation elongation factor P/translation initiation factor 5A
LTVAENLELAPLGDQENYSFLYSSDGGETLVFMETSTFEQVGRPSSSLLLWCLLLSPVSLFPWQIEIRKEKLGDKALYLQEGTVLKIQRIDGEPILFHLPKSVVMEVVVSHPCRRAPLCV